MTKKRTHIFKNIFERHDNYDFSPSGTDHRAPHLRQMKNRRNRNPNPPKVRKSRKNRKCLRNLVQLRILQSMTAKSPATAKTSFPVKTAKRYVYISCSRHLYQLITLAMWMRLNVFKNVFSYSIIYVTTANQLKLNAQLV